jgi:Putative prokaryotic signal transducing protein
LTTVPNEGEAEILCTMLRVEGIRCFHRITDNLAFDDSGQAFGGWREILVAESDFARAQELLSKE